MAGKEPTGQSAITRSRMEATSAAGRSWLMPRRRQGAGHRQQPPCATQRMAAGLQPGVPLLGLSTCLGLPSVGANPSPRRRASGSNGRGWQGSPGGQPAAAPRQGQVGLHVPAGADGQGREPHDHASAGTMPLAA